MFKVAYKHPKGEEEFGNIGHHGKKQYYDCNASTLTVLFVSLPS